MHVMHVCMHESMYICMYVMPVTCNVCMHARNVMCVQCNVCNGVYVM